MLNHIIFILVGILGLYLANPVLAFFFGVGISFFGINKNLNNKLADNMTESGKSDTPAIISTKINTAINRGN